MKIILTVLFCLCVLVGCKHKSPTVEIADPIIEKEIRRVLEKPSGELTKADLEKVTRLHLYYNKLTEVPNDLEKLTQLNDLFLEYNQLTSVKRLEKLTQLSTLHLSANQLTTVKGLEKLTQVKTMRLSAFEMTEPPKGLEKLSQLEKLHLENYPPLKMGVADHNVLNSVERLEKLPLLRHLSLSGSVHSDVKGLEKLTQVKSMRFDVHLDEVPKGLEKLTQLEMLRLVTCHDVKALEKLTNLRELSLHTASGQAAQIAELQKALPNCKIESNPKK